MFYQILQEEEKRKKKQREFITSVISALVGVLIVKWIWPQAIPFDLFQFWGFNGSLVNVLSSSWFLYVWAMALCVVRIVATKIVYKRYAYESDFTTSRKSFRKNVKESLLAGVFEEIIFRWIFFYSMIVALQIFNFVLGGFAGHGLMEWIAIHIDLPIAGFVTFRVLSPIIAQYPWFIGGAITVANGRFQKVYTYQGWFGLINAWYTGWFLYFIMFHYGLFAAMLVHCLYNFIFDIFNLGAMVLDERK